MTAVGHRGVHHAMVVQGCLDVDAVRRPSERYPCSKEFSTNSHRICTTIMTSTRRRRCRTTRPAMARAPRGPPGRR